MKILIWCTDCHKGMLKILNISPHSAFEYLTHKKQSVKTRAYMRNMYVENTRKLYIFSIKYHKRIQLSSLRHVLSSDQMFDNFRAKLTEPTIVLHTCLHTIRQHYKLANKKEIFLANLINKTLLALQFSILCI